MRIHQPPTTQLTDQPPATRPLLPNPYSPIHNPQFTIYMQSLLLDKRNNFYTQHTQLSIIATIKYSNIIVDEIQTGEFDFIKLEGLPLGAATYGMNVKALETVCRIKKIIDTEIWGYLINRPEIFKIKKIMVQDELNRPELRFTLDYEEDYEFINNIYNNVPFDNVLVLTDVIDYLDKKSMIDINKVGCMGWSQGGYISAFLTTNTNRFKAISVGAGISNWVTYYVNTDTHPFTRQYLKANPWNDPDIYAKTSPMTTIKKAKTPPLIDLGPIRID